MLLRVLKFSRKKIWLRSTILQRHYVEQQKTGQTNKEQLTQTDSKEGMMIGMDTGQQAHDRGRAMGIDHIVQTVRDPKTGQLMISQSSSSGKGYLLTPANAWLAQQNKSKTKLFGVDPFAMVDKTDPAVQKKVAKNRRRQRKVPLPPRVRNGKRSSNLKVLLLRNPKLLPHSRKHLNLALPMQILPQRHNHKHLPKSAGSETTASATATATACVRKQLKRSKPWLKFRVKRGKYLR